jgi:hypothetical protein
MLNAWRQDRLRKIIFKTQLNKLIMVITPINSPNMLVMILGLSFPLKPNIRE